MHRHCIAFNSAMLSAIAIALLLSASVVAGQNSTAEEVKKSKGQGEEPLFTGPIVINEVLGKPANKSSSLAQANSWDVITASVEWVELANTGSTEVDVSNWVLSRADKSFDSGWTVPTGVKVPAAGFMVILVPSKKQALPPIPAGTNVQVATNIKVGSNGLALYKPDGTLAASTGRLPPNMPGVSVGRPVPAPAADTAPYTYLAKPTPFLANAGARPGVGPFIRSIKAEPDGVVEPGQAITVSAKVTRNQAPVSSVILLMRVNYTPEQEIPMTAAGEGGSVATYTATIPGSLMTAGAMIRWRVKATDTAAGTSLEPNGLVKGEPQYEGTAVRIAVAEAVAANASVSVPVLYWYTEDPAAATTTNGFPGSLSFNGAFYDNVFGSRRGVTSLVWNKPKLKFDVPNGFSMRSDIPEFNTVKLNSYYYEVGERSFMKEALAYKVMEEEGVVAPENQYVQVYLNGQFYGLYGMIEEVGTSMLERFKLPPTGPLFKSQSGELSNLRWDLAVPDMPAYYSRPNRKQFPGEWGLLANLTKGLAGGGPGTRTSYLFDNLNLPAVVNENAVQTLLLNQDRCTKNFLVYYNPETKEWIRIPWDVETSFAQDNGLGGTPGPLYCILACEQWNSPLYCDSEHPQDLGNVKTSWGTITAVGLNPYQGSAVRGTSGRRLAQQSPTTLPAEGTKPLTFAKSDDWANPDRVQYGTRSVIGAPGSYNHLTDALLDVTATRAMYMRRLRTLADKYYAQGKLRALVDATWSRIQGLAAQDNVVWKVGDGSRGYQQITTEFIPIRSKQLLQTYAPGGPNPLLPGPQDNSKVALTIAAVQVASPREQSYVALAVSSPQGEAVDISGWKVTAGSSTWSFPPGTVIPPGHKLHLSPSVSAFRSRATSPKAGEAAFVIEVPDSLIPGDSGGVSWSIVDEDGKSVQLSVGA